MQCTHCQKRQANLFFSETVNGRTRSASLCSECAARHNVTIQMPKLPAFLGGFLFGNFGDDLEPMISQEMNTFFEQSGERAPEKTREKSTQQLTQKDVDLLALTKEIEEALAAEDFKKAAFLKKRIEALRKSERFG